MTTVQLLASFYNPEIEQELKLGQIVYKHLPNEDWFILDELSYRTNSS